MRLDTADRSFFSLAATALVPFALLGLFGCGVLSLLAYRVGTDGWAGLTRDGQDLRPAAVLFAVVAAGTVAGAWSVYRQVAATRTLAGEVAARTTPATAKVAGAAAHAGLVGRVDLVGDAQPYSFTYGLARPRVAVSSGLVDAVGIDELAAVLAHERYHVRSADTVKMIVARAAPSAFFFLPALHPLRERYLAGRELAADRAAVRAAGEEALAGALFKVLDGPMWADFGTAAALGGGVLEHRLEQLEAGCEPPLPGLPRQAVLLTVAALGAIAGLFALAIGRGGTDLLAMDGSLPDSGGGGAALTIFGGVACTAAMAALVVTAARSGRRHRRSG